MKILHPEDMKAYLEAWQRRPAHVLPGTGDGIRRRATALLWYVGRRTAHHLGEQAGGGDRHRNVTISRPKTERLRCQKISIPQSAVELLQQEHKTPGQSLDVPSPKTGRCITRTPSQNSLIRSEGHRGWRHPVSRSAHTLLPWRCKTGVDVKTRLLYAGTLRCWLPLCITYTPHSRRCRNRQRKMGNFMERVV